MLKRLRKTPNDTDMNIKISNLEIFIIHTLIQNYLQYNLYDELNELVLYYQVSLLESKRDFSTFPRVLADINTWQS